MPLSTTLIASQSQRFIATVEESSNTAVKWSVSPAVGIITAAGLYTAPSVITASQTVTITAISAADPSQKASATVTLSMTTPPSITTASPLPAGTTGNVYSQTLAATGTTPIAWTVSSGTLPDGLTLGSSTGIISGTPTTAGSSTFTVIASNSAGISLKQLSLTVNVAATAPTITTASPLPAATTGTAYSQTFTATGTTPVNWSVTSGTLPAGLNLASSTGVLSGTPTASGAWTFTVTATNIAGTSSKALSLTVNTPAIAPSVTTVSPLPAATTGTAYSQNFSATGTIPIAWTVTSGTLPAGLTLGSSTGALSGTPTAAGAFTFTVTATNSAGANSKALSLTVTAPAIAPSITTASPLAAATTGTAYSQTLAATGTTPIAWTVTSGALPAGLSLGSSTGALSGTPTAAGAFTFTVTATNSAGTNSKALSLIVNQPLTILLSPPTVSLLPAQSQTFTATVSGTSNTGVTWSFSPSSASLATSGSTALYLAPSTAPTAQSGTIIATSVADPSKTATAVISLLQAVTISLSPSTVSLAPSGTQQFSATVLGTTNTAVTWSVSPALGTITAAGLYAAPSSIAGSRAVTVTATSAASAGVLASAVVTLSPPVSVTLTPGSVILTQSQTQSFAATVGNTSNTAVTWSISPSIGSISPAGVYTAPSSILTSRTVTVTAQSVADPTKSASTTISCIPVTYYVDSVNGSDSNPGTQAAPWQTIAKVNATKLLPGQTVAFATGRVWRETLISGWSGTPGSPIIYTSYGSGAKPVITGADVISGWTNYPTGSGGKTWRAPVSTEPAVVSFNGTLGTPVASVAACTSDKQWYWSGGQLYVYGTVNPNVTYPSQLEAADRSYAVDNRGSYVTFSNLDVALANINALHVSSYGADINGVTVDGITARQSYGYGIYLSNDGGGHILDGTIIRNSTTYRNGLAGIHGGADSAIDTTLVDGNTVYGNNFRSDSTGLDKAGIHFYGTLVTNLTIQNNEVFDNGDLLPNFQSVSLGERTGHGIYADTVGSGLVIRYNTVYNDNLSGIVIENTSGSAAYNNIVYGHSVAPGISYWHWGGSASENNLICNNTLFENYDGIALWGTDARVGTITGNAVKNNVSFNNVEYALRLENGAENDGVFGYGNVYLYNNFGPEAANFIEWGSGKNISTYAALQSAYGSVTYSIVGDPQFTDAASFNFTLKPTSPDIGTGMYVQGVSSVSSPNVGAR